MNQATALEVTLMFPISAAFLYQFAQIQIFMYIAWRNRIDARLFDDFPDADACVVITRPDEFKVRVRNAVSAELPGWKFLAGPVLYFDPFFCHVHEMVPHFWKHFRFSYQKEHRLAWLPPKPSDDSPPNKLDHIWFEIGPLTDCAELVWL